MTDSNQMADGDGISWIIKGSEQQFKSPLIMGILNITPDSFSDGGSYHTVDQAVEYALYMVDAGADIIDIGGESTRPGSLPVSEAEELGRVIPVIKALSAKTTALISIDTQKARVAKAAIQHGAHIVNDVSAGLTDENMMQIVSENQAVYVMMHMQGVPENMQDSPHYDNIIKDVKSFFERRIELAESQGIKRSHLIVDPGIGFGKTLENNLDILANIDSFHSLGCPLLLGASRKSFIDKIDASAPNERLGGSIAAVVAAHAKNVQIFRVHDVRETRQALNIFTAIQKHLD